MRKRICLLLALALLVCFAMPTALSESAEAPTYVSWVTYQAGVCDEDASMVKYWNEMFNLDIDVWNLDNANRDAQMALWIAGGTIPDVIYYGMSQTTFRSYVDQGVLAEIPEDLLNAHMPGVVSIINDTMGEDAWLYAKVDGKLYGVPRGTGCNVKFRQPLVYRGDWMEKVGVTETPETLEDFEALMYMFAKDDPDGNGIDDTYGLSASGMRAVYGSFGYLPDQWKMIDGTIQNTSIQPEMKEALRTFAKWYKDGVLAPDYVTGENYGGYWAISHAFVNGVIGYTGHGQFYHWTPDLGTGEWHDLKEMTTVLGADAANAVVYGQPFTGPEGYAYTGAAAAPIDGVNISFGVQLEKEPERMGKIMDFIEYINSDVEHYLVAYGGIEGETWARNDDGSIRLLVNEPLLYTMGASATFLLANAVGQNAMYKTRNDWAEANGFVVDNNVMVSDVIDALPSQSVYGTELNRIKNAAYTAIITGEKDIDSFDAFVEEWLAAGGATLTEEANEAYQSHR